VADTHPKYDGKRTLGIDLDQIWDIVHDDLLELKRAIQTILDDIKD
jgi:uncharacterized protein with HEPN domain